MKVLIAGGGTGGHINPGIAIAKQILKDYPSADIRFAGTDRGLETKLVPREGFKLELITVRGFKRKLSIDTFRSVRDLFRGLAQARKLIKGFKPDIVIGTGGYVCGPVLFSASRMKIPTLIHEQNAFPGVTNRILARFVNKVAISFEESRQYFSNPAKLVCTGNPVRAEVLNTKKDGAKAKVGVKPDKPLVVITGGSLGAPRINETIVEILKKYYKGDEFSLIFSTGNRQFDDIKENLKGLKLPLAQVTPYIYDAASVYAAADIMICRSGAITCSELTAIGLPAIMIPSPNVTANHQEHNARSLEKNGAAIVILEKDLNAETLYNQIVELFKDKVILEKMSVSAKKIGITDAAEKLGSMAKELISTTL